jgi:hypothetical protein
MAISESWLHGDDRDKKTIADVRNMLPDHTLYHQPRKARGGGGVCVIIKKGFSVTVHDISDFKSFDLLDMTIVSGSTAMRLFTIYRPQYSSRRNKMTTPMFLTEFSTLLESVVLISTPVALVGDFNIHVNDETDTDARAFLEVLESAGLKQLVDFPTHRLGNTLDLVVTNMESKLVDDLMPDYALRGSSDDHVAISCRLNVTRPAATKKTLRFRKFKNLNVSAFCEDIKASPLVTTPADTVDGLVKQYSTMRLLLI